MIKGKENWKKKDRNMRWDREKKTFVSKRKRLKERTEEKQKK